MARTSGAANLVGCVQLSKSWRFKPAILVINALTFKRRQLDRETHRAFEPTMVSMPGAFNVENDSGWLADLTFRRSGRTSIPAESNAL